MIFDPVMLDPMPGDRSGGPAYASGSIGNMLYTAAMAGSDGNLIGVTHNLAPATSAVAASLSIDGMTYRARNAGVGGNSITVQHSSAAIAAIAAGATIGGIAYTAISSGAAGNNISVTASLGSAAVAGTATLNRSIPSLGVDWPFTITDKPAYYGVPTTVRLMGSSIETPSAALPATGVNDPYFANTPILVRAGSTSTVINNNTFRDSSTNALTVSRTGNVQQGTFSPHTKPDGYWSTFFSSSSDYMSVTDNVAFTFTGDFTIEAWISPTVAASQSIVSHWQSGLATGCSFALHLTATNALRFSYGIGPTNLAIESAASAITLNQWSHVAVSRSGTSLMMFVNGQLVNSTTASGSLNNCPNPLYIGTTTTDFFRGYISNLRLVKGTAVYTGAFSVPTSPLTAVSGTSLLTCQSNNVFDRSSNGFTITASYAKVLPIGPFASPEYTVATNGASAYFDGVGDLAAISDNNAFTLSGNFTIEAWIYADLSTGAAAEQTIAAHWLSASAIASSFILATTSTTGVKFTYAVGSTTATLTGAAGSLRSSAWNHVAVTRSSGSIRLFANGRQVASGFSASALNNSTSNLTLGYRTSTETFYLKGYVSDFRVINGSAAYTAAFAVPTAPLTVAPSTALLLSFANAEIQNLGGLSNIETAGSTISWSIGNKYNSKSVYFDGVGDYLSIGPVNNPHLAIGTADFTIEAWIYRTAGGSGFPALYANYGGSRSGAHLLRIIGPTNKAAFYVYPSTDVVTSTSDIALNTWTHIAVSRSGSNTYLYVNGVLEASSTTAYTLTSDPLHPATSGGYWQSAAIEPNGYFTGRIEDLRVTVGVARYEGATSVTRELSGSTEIVRFPNNTSVNQILAVVGDGGTNVSSRVSISATPSTATLSFTDPASNPGATTSGGSSAAPLSVAVTGSDISITLSASGSTSAEVCTLLTNTASTAALVSATPSVESASAAAKTFLSGGVNASAGVLAASASGDAVSISVPVGTTNVELKSFLEGVESIAGASGIIDLVDPAGSAPVSSGPLGLAGGADQVPGVLGIAVVGNAVSVSVPAGTVSADLVTALNANAPFAALAVASASDADPVETTGTVTLSGGQ
jgi:hypothetical protein